MGREIGDRRRMCGCGKEKEREKERGRDMTCGYNVDVHPFSFHLLRF